MIMNSIQFNSIYVDQISFNFPFGCHGFIGKNLCQGSSWSISWFGADALIVVRDSGRFFARGLGRCMGVSYRQMVSTLKKRQIRNRTTTKKVKLDGKKIINHDLGHFKMDKPRLPPNWIMAVLNLGPVAHNKVLIPKQVPMRCYTENPFRHLRHIDILSHF